MLCLLLDFLNLSYISLVYKLVLLWMVLFSFRFCFRVHLYQPWLAVFIPQPQNSEYIFHDRETVYLDALHKNGSYEVKI